jgi:hypothetical protein
LPLSYNFFIILDLSLDYKRFMAVSPAAKGLYLDLTQAAH